MSHRLKTTAFGLLAASTVFMTASVCSAQGTRGAQRTRGTQSMGVGVYWAGPPGSVPVLSELGSLSAGTAWLPPTATEIGQDDAVDTAVGAARSAGLGVAVVVQVSGLRSAAIRGTNLKGAATTISFAVVDVASGQQVVGASGKGMAFGTGAVVREASTSALMHGWRLVAKRVRAKWPMAGQGGAPVRLTITGTTSGAALVAIDNRLRKLNIAVATREYTRGRSRYRVKPSVTAPRLAAIVRGTSVAGVSMRVTVRGGEVHVAVTEAQR